MNAYNAYNEVFGTEYKNEMYVKVVNHKHLAKVCAEKGLVRKVTEGAPYRYRLFKGETYLGFVGCYPSNNLKFYAGNSEDARLFKTFSDAVNYVTD